MPVISLPFFCPTSLPVPEPPAQEIVVVVTGVGVAEADTDMNKYKIEITNLGAESHGLSSYQEFIGLYFKEGA